MKNVWGDEIEVSGAESVNEWGDPIHIEQPGAQHSSLTKAIFPSATQTFDSVYGQPATPWQTVKDVGNIALHGAGDLLGLTARIPAKVFGGQPLSDPSSNLMRDRAAQAGQNAQQDLNNAPEGFDPLKSYGVMSSMGGMPYMPATPAMAPGLAQAGGLQLGDAATYIPAAGVAAENTLNMGKAALRTETTGKVLSAAEKISNLPNKAAGKLAQELSSVSEEALRMATTKEGRAALKANAGKEYEIGQKLVNMLDNPKEFAPNKALVDKALKGMGEVDIAPVIQVLEDAKIKRASGKIWEHEKAANDAIQKDIDNLLGVDKKTSLPASEALDLRRGMDDVIDHTGDQKQINIVNAAKLKARKAMKVILEKKAEETGNPEYVQGMRELHKQFEARDRLIRFLGKNKAAQEDRAESFISNMWGKNKKNRQMVMNDIGQAFGKDFLEESKLANLASQLGPEGDATWLSRASTGRSRLGGAAGFLLGGSPKVATRIILPLTELPPKAIKWIRELSKAKTKEEKAFYMGNLNKAGVSAETIKKALEEINKPKAQE